MGVMSADSQHSGDNAFVRFLKRRWLAIVLVILLVIVAIQNLIISSDKATLYVLWAQVVIPTWALVLIVFVVGAITGWVFARNRASKKAQSK